MLKTKVTAMPPNAPLTDLRGWQQLKSMAPCGGCQVGSGAHAWHAVHVLS